MAVQLRSIRQSQSHNTRNVRAGHRGSLHIAITQLGHIVRQGGKHAAQCTAVRPVAIFPIIVLVPARSGNGSARAIVRINRRSIVSRSSRNGHEVPIRTRIAGHTRRFIASGKYCDAAFNHAVRRACIMDKIVQSFALQSIVRHPLLVVGVHRLPIVCIRST